jgi:hypothetical protein
LDGTENRRRSAGRKLILERRAMLVHAYLGKGQAFAELAAGFGVGISAAWRYVKEIVALVAARALKRRQAVRNARRAGDAYVVLDGALIHQPRCRGPPGLFRQTPQHGMNL